MKPGVYNIPMSDYLSDSAISSSGLKHLARSPAHYQQYRKEPPESTPDQVMGTILHHCVFTPDDFKDSHYVRPKTYVNAKDEEKPWHASAKECKTWASEHQGRPTISEDTSETITNMHSAVMRHPAARAALSAKGGKAEQSAFCIDPVSQMPIKARFDFVVGNSLVDLKKCRDASPAGFAKQVANYGYDLQAAFHSDVASILELGVSHFVFIAVEDCAPFAVSVFELTPKSLAAGQSKFRRLMSRYADCVEKDQWPAYSANVEYLELPAYALNAEFNALLLEDQPAMPALEV